MNNSCPSYIASIGHQHCTWPWPAILCAQWNVPTFNICHHRPAWRIIVVVSASQLAEVASSPSLACCVAICALYLPTREPTWGRNPWPGLTGAGQALWSLNNDLWPEKCSVYMVTPGEHAFHVSRGRRRKQRSEKPPLSQKYEISPQNWLYGPKSVQWPCTYTSHMKRKTASTSSRPAVCSC